jgi:hypothetical protein
LKRLGAEVEAGFKAGTGPVDMLRKLWPYVEQLAGEGKARQALDAMKKVEEVLAKTSAAKTGEAAGEVPKDTTAKAACAQMLKDLEARARPIARAGVLFPDRAKVIEELARKARSAAEADDLKTTQAAMGAIGKLLDEAAKAEVALAAAQAKAETARGEATALTAKYEALIGKPLPKSVADPTAAAGKDLETAAEVDPAKIGLAVDLGREKLAEATRIGDRIAKDKAGWAPVRQGFAQLLKALLANAEGRRGTRRRRPISCCTMRAAPSSRRRAWRSRATARCCGAHRRRSEKTRSRAPARAAT